MATVTSLTADRLLALEADTVIGGHVAGDNLILEQHDGSTIDAGNVRGPGSPSSATVVGDTTILRTSDGRGKVATPTATDDATTKAYVDAADTSLDGRLDTLEGQTLDARLDVLEGQTLDVRLDALEVLTELDISSWVQTGWGTYDSAVYGTPVAWVDTVRKMIDINAYIKRTGSNTASAQVHSPIVIPSTYRPTKRVLCGSWNDIGTLAENYARTVILHKTEASNPGRVDIVLPSSQAWATNEYAFLTARWKYT